MVYNISRATYDSVEHCTIELPDDLELVTGGPSDIGNMLHVGYLHYTAVMKASEYNKCKKLFAGKIFIYVHKLCDLRFICFHNIKFEGNSPKIITAEELNNKWDFKKYYIMKWSDDVQLTSMFKIDYVRSEYDIDCLQVTHRDWTGHTPISYIKHDKGISLDQLLIRCHDIIKIFKGGKCKEYWDTLISDVLKKFGIKHRSKNVDLDAAYKIACKNREEYKKFIDLQKALPNDGLTYVYDYNGGYMSQEIFDILDMNKIIYRNEE